MHQNTKINKKNAPEININHFKNEKHLIRFKIYILYEL